MRFSARRSIRKVYSAIRRVSSCHELIWPQYRLYGCEIGRQITFVQQWPTALSQSGSGPNAGHLACAWLIRDDAGHPYLNGNKTYKARRLVDRIVASGASDAVIMAGSMASNNAVAMGLELSRAGVRPWLGLRKSSTIVPTGSTQLEGNCAIASVLYNITGETNVLTFEAEQFDRLAAPGCCHIGSANLLPAAGDTTNI